MTIWCMPIACWISKSTNTHSVQVTLTDFLLNQWLHACASILCYIYSACPVCFEWKGCTYDIKNHDMSKFTHYQRWWSFLRVSVITFIIRYPNRTISITFCDFLINFLNNNSNTDIAATNDNNNNNNNGPLLLNIAKLHTAASLNSRQDACHSATQKLLHFLLLVLLCSKQSTT